MISLCLTLSAPDDVIRSVLRQRLRNIRNQVFYEGGAGFDIVALLTKHFRLLS